MATSGQQSNSFACPGCGKTFPWNNRYAGRRVTCSCGHQFMAAVGGTVIDARANEPVDFVDDAVPVRPAPVIPPRQAIAPGSRPPMPGSRPLMTEDDEPMWKWLHAPVLLIAAGLGGRIASGMAMSWNKPPATVVGLVLCETVLSVALMLAGALLAARLMSINFGSVGRTVVKLTGMALAGAAVCSFVLSWDKGQRGMGVEVIAVYGTVMTYWVCFTMLFDLDFQEVLLTTAIVGFIQAMGACVLWHS